MAGFFSSKSFSDRFLDIHLFFAQGFSDAARHQNANKEENDDANPDPGGPSHVVLDHGLELDQAPVGVDLLLGLGFGHVNSSFSAVFSVGNTAEIGDLS